MTAGRLRYFTGKPGVQAASPVRFALPDGTGLAVARVYTPEPPTREVDGKTLLVGPPELVFVLTPTGNPDAR